MWKLLRLALVGAFLAYCGLLAGLFALQRDFIYEGTGASVLSEPEALAVPGSERVEIPTADGETLAGWYRPPASADKPTFLFFHGNVGRLEQMKARWSALSEAGAGVLAFSYRGFPGSTGKPDEEGLYRDARAAYAWLADRQPADRIVLHGLSLGTGVAAKLATEVEARALILEAPYTAVVDLVGEKRPWVPVSMLLQDQFRTRDVISDVKMPVLIIHGDKDETIPHRHAQQLIDLAPKPKQLVTIPGGGHTTLVSQGLFDHVWRFLDGVAQS